MRARRTSRTILRIAYDRCVRGLGLLLVAAACNPPGLTLEIVVDDPSISKVEIFAGSTCEDDCPLGTIAPGLPALPVDAGFIVYDPAPFTAVASDFDGGVAGFRIETAHDTVLGILVVVAYNGQDEVVASSTFHDVAVPTNEPARWRVELTPTTVIGPALDRQPAGTERIKQWRDATGLPACMLLEHWSDSAVPVRELVAPDGDHDCDGVAAANECAPWVPNASGLEPRLANASCVTQVSDLGASICMIGGPQCTESSTAPQGQCVALEDPYCVPSSLCTCSGDANTTACVKQLVIQGTSDMNTLPAMKCEIHVDAAGERCDSGPLTLDGSAYFTGGARTCKSLRFLDSDAPLAAFGSALHLGEAKLKIESLADPCTAELYWAAGTAPPVGYGLVDLELDNGYHLVVPARVDVKASCVDRPPSSCSFVTGGDPNETMFTCAQAIAGAPRCGRDLTHQCEGAYCNGQCCARGESCGPNGCQCGTGGACTGTDACEYQLANSDNCGELCCGIDNPCPF